MDERTQEIIAMIRASGDGGYSSITDEELARTIKKGGYKEIQNIYDAGWRKPPVENFHICSSCGKKFIGLNDFGYGLRKGKPFAYKLCPECSNNLTEEQKEDLITIIANKNK